MLARVLIVVSVMLIGTSAIAQTPSSTPAKPVRMILENARIAIVVDRPLHYKLLRVTLPAGRVATYSGSDGMLYIMSGILEIGAAAERRTLREGAGVFVPRASGVKLSAANGSSVTALHFVLVGPTELESNGYDRQATVTEVYRTEKPISGLKPGPHEFTLTKVTAGNIPAPPMHHRSGAALYYVLAGDWTLQTETRTQSRSRGAIQFEPNDFVHTWQNVGETAGILLQANISSEGVPEIIFVPPR
jgi:quercetin dioxygenase-like cupin family protein